MKIIFSFCLIALIANTTSLMATTMLQDQLPSCLVAVGTKPIYPEASPGKRRALNVKYISIDGNKNGRVQFTIATKFSHTEEEWKYGVGRIKVKHDDENSAYDYDLPIDEFKLLSLVILGRITPYKGYRALHAKHHTNLDVVEDENGKRIEGWRQRYYNQSRSSRGEMWYEFDERYCRAKIVGKEYHGPGIGMLLHWIDHEERTAP
ncbi:MAG: hypothetical protein K2X93_16180, partial [Candidatus Obscuribacterales bacterium]|nr:hypothetical protein [Candidatus Obscuribacterales bacterium]